MRCAALWFAFASAVLCLGCGGDDGKKSSFDSDDSSDDGGSPAVAQPGEATDPHYPPPTFAEIDASMQTFFAEMPAASAPAPTPLSADQIGGAWEAKIVSIDLGPDVPPPVVSELPPIRFRVEKSGEGWTMVEAEGDRRVALAADAAGGLQTRPEGDGKPPVHLKLDGELLIGEMGGNDSGKVVFHARRVP